MLDLLVTITADLANDLRCPANSAVLSYSRDSRRPRSFEGDLRTSVGLAGRHVDADGRHGRLDDVGTIGLEPSFEQRKTGMA